MSMNATVTLPAEEWQAQIIKRQEAEQRAAELANQLTSALLNSNDLMPDLVEGLLAAHELVVFLIAHAHPDVVKTQPWPHQALTRFANMLEKLPMDAPAKLRYQEAAIDMRDMAREAERWNMLRAERRHRLSMGLEPGPEPTAEIVATIENP